MPTPTPKSKYLGLRLNLGPLLRPSRLTKARRRALAALVAGEHLEVDDAGRYMLGATTLSTKIARALIEEGLVSQPAPVAPLFNLPAEPGVITECGRNRLERE